MDGQGMGSRRDFLRLAGAGLTAVTTAGALGRGAGEQVAPSASGVGQSSTFDVSKYGAKGDGKTIDTAAINSAIDAAAATGGGTVLFPAGIYASYSLHLKSHVGLYLDSGAVILAAAVPLEGTRDGYDPAEPQGPWEMYQDFGHNHWHSSLMWGENLHDVAIVGPGLIWGRGLSRGLGRDKDLPSTKNPFPKSILGRRSQRRAGFHPTSDCC